MTSDEMRRLIDTDPDFIYSRKFDNSLNNLLDKYGTKGVPRRTVAQVLMMTENEVDEITDRVLQKLKTALKV